MIRDALILVGLLFAAWSAYCAVFLLIARRPVTARVIGTDGSDRHRFRSINARRLALVQDFIAPEGTRYEAPLLEVAYELDGREYRNHVRDLHMRGDGPDPAMILWVDPHDPNRFTDKGLGLQLRCMGYGRARRGGRSGVARSLACPPDALIAAFAKLP